MPEPVESRLWLPRYFANVVTSSARVIYTAQTKVVITGVWCSYRPDFINPTADQQTATGQLLMYEGSTPGDGIVLPGTVLAYINRLPGRLIAHADLAPVWRAGQPTIVPCSHVVNQDEKFVVDVSAGQSVTGLTVAMAMSFAPVGYSLEDQDQTQGFKAR